MNERGKAIDTTYLSLETAEERGFIHRDYIAHCLRWSHVIKYLQEKKRYESARVLDVGCGRELPLPTTMYSSRLIVRNYYGVDYGPIEDRAMERFHSGKFPIKAFERTDFLDLALSDLDGAPVDLITCFEVLEHVEPMHCMKMLRHMQTLLSDDGVAFISTPCWDVVSCAANHVNEMRYETLGVVLENLKWNIRGMWGTFASIKDYWHKIPSDLEKYANKLREYYDVNFLSCIFAPMFPEASRNCLWMLQKDSFTHNIRRFRTQSLDEVPKPWSSSAKWADFAKPIE